MLGKPCRFPERRGRVGIGAVRIISPGFGFQRIDGVLTGQEIDIAAAECGAELLVLRLRIETDELFAGFPKVGEDEL